jgi:Na+/proline symporter
VKRLLLFNGLLRFPITLAYCCGGLILGTFAVVNSEFGSKIPATKPDLMVPVFIAHYLPHGVIGLIVVALIAAWMSAYSSALNSLTAVTMEDFIGRKFAVPAEKYVPLSKVIALGWGLFTLGFGFFTGKIAATAIEAINKIGSVFYGPIIGMFLLATLGGRIKPLGANLGVVCGVAVNLVLWLWFKNVFWFWWNAIGGMTTLAIGVGVSVAAGVSVSREEIKLRPAGTPAATREIVILAAYFAVIVTFCVLLPRMFEVAP